MKFTATVIVTVDNKKTSTTTCSIETETGITVSEVKKQCYDSLKLPKEAKFEKVKEEVWLDTPLTPENPVRKPAEDNFVMFNRVFQTFDYYLDLKIIK